MHAPAPARLTTLRFMQFDWRPGAYAVVIHDQSVLLSLWQGPYQQIWTLPGGGIEYGEHFRHDSHHSCCPATAQRAARFDAAARALPCHHDLRIVTARN